MRWERLFDDLEAQLQASEDAELAAEVADRTRRELARTSLTERLLASIGAPVAVTVHGAGLVRATLSDVGTGWLLLAQGPTELLVPLDAMTSVGGLAGRTGAPLVGVQRSLGLAWALRGVVRDRSAVTAQLTDGSAVTGTPDRVGSDYLDIAEHPAGEPRRGSAVVSVRTVPLSALGLLRRV